MKIEVVLESHKIEALKARLSNLGLRNAEKKIENLEEVSKIQERIVAEKVKLTEST